MKFDKFSHKTLPDPPPKKQKTQPQISGFFTPASTKLPYHDDPNDLAATVAASMKDIFVAPVNNAPSPSVPGTYARVMANDPTILPEIGTASLAFLLHAKTSSTALIAANEERLTKFSRERLNAFIPAGDRAAQKSCTDGSELPAWGTFSVPHVATDTNSRRKLFFGHYPKPAKGDKIYNQKGCISPFQQDPTRDGQFVSPAMETHYGFFAAEGITREMFLSTFSMTDIMAINLPYKSSWKLFKKILRETDPELYDLMMTAFNTQHAELAAYLDINNSSVIIPLGKQPLEYIRTHRLFENAEVKAVPHPVTMRHISNAPDKDSMKKSEEVYILLCEEILGKSVQYSEYFRAWKAQNGEAWSRMLENRKTTQYGGIFMTKSQLDKRFDHSFAGSEVSQYQLDKAFDHGYTGSEVSQYQLDKRFDHGYAGSEVTPEVSTGPSHRRLKNV